MGDRCRGRPSSFLLAAGWAAAFLVSLVGSSSSPPLGQLACDPSDLQALSDFAGNLSNGWSILPTWSRESASCCNWEGVSCTRDVARVTGLKLPGRGLKGTIPSSVGLLDKLTSLDLSHNLLHGTLPPELSRLARLELLNLSFNALSGPVTPAIAGLRSVRFLDLSSNCHFNGTDLFGLQAFPSLTTFNVSNNSFAGPVGPDACLGSGLLRVLDLSMNRFSGELSEEALSNCSAHLQELYLDSNSLSGNLPSSLFDLVSLKNLSLPSNNLSGSLPERLSNLSSLRVLILWGNHFDGPLPDVFGNLTMLGRFIAHSNMFSGSLPSSLSRCPVLQDLDLRNNSLSGRIDLNFSPLSLLSSLDLATNNFSGTLPVSIVNCLQLKTLSLAKNNLTGHVPEEFGKLVSLSFLSLSNNSLQNISAALDVLGSCRNLTALILTRNFHGEEMPRNMVGFENLKIFAVGNCALTGQIPEWLMYCKKLEVLDLSWNRLNGFIPSWIGQFENLFYLDISNNTLSGPIPISFTSLKSLVSASAPSWAMPIGLPLYVKRNMTSSGLQYNQISSFPPALYLNDNGINGTIWPEFGRLKQLHVLDLSHNNITGIIPDTISEMRNLEILDLSCNDLYGSIPLSLKRLTFLSKFSVANNNLSGEIPTGGQFFSFSNSSFEGNPGLCGAPGPPCNRSSATDLYHRIPSGSPGKIGRSSILGITISVGVGIAVLLAVVLFNMSRRDAGYPVDEDDLEDRPNRMSESVGSKLVLLFQNSDGKELTISDLLKSTNNFDQANIIGCGGFGLVYKANLPDGTKAAIKRLSGDCGQIEREFQAEVESLSRAQHKNLVSLKGYCRLGNDRLLIYSYMENGSLDYWLHERVDGGSLLRWDSRLKIAQGAARGLCYLHKVCEPNIIHRDVKSSNILLDERFEAHLADFGLSRLICPYDTHVTTDLVGTLGYIPPEYSQTLTATLKGDVFSFGVVLLELLTGKRPVDICKARGNRDLVSWVLQMKSEGKEEQIFDTVIWNNSQEKQLRAVLETACKCINQDPRHRPSIEQVVSWLDGVGAYT
uniref:non-specific serine/threonine protein kinase n=1 Tax=Anthurium amnicola TaxID=1678845 RepID=A0A1D1Y5X2_9ARAE